MKDNSVTVVIPTYNRAHIIDKTLPSYIQDNVLELIVIDDKSDDDTEKVIRQLQLNYPNIIYHKSTKKIRQTGAKNIGIRLAKGDYIYFGDDDSVLKKGSIKRLLKIAKENEKSIIAVRHVYMDENDDLETILSDKKFITTNKNSFFDRSNLKLDLRFRINQVIEIPFCQACMLVPSEIAKTQLFNTNFYGTCYREETDFVMQIASKGYKILLDNYSLQVNLPKSQSSGGTRSVHFIYRHTSEVINEYIFYKRNSLYIKSISEINANPLLRSAIHLIKKFIK